MKSKNGRSLRSWWCTLLEHRMQRRTETLRRPYGRLSRILYCYTRQHDRDSSDKFLRGASHRGVSVEIQDQAGFRDPPPSRNGALSEFKRARLSPDRMGSHID